MKNLKFTSFCLILSFMISCAEKSTEPIIQQSADQIRVNQIEDDFKAGKMPMMDRGILGISLPEGKDRSFRYDISYKEDFLSYGSGFLKVGTKDWNTLNSFFRNEIERFKGNENSHDIYQHIGNDALFFLVLYEDINPSNHLDDVAFYTDLIVNLGNGNTYLIGTALEILNRTNHWEKDKIRNFAIQSLRAPGLPAESTLTGLVESVNGSVVNSNLLDKHNRGIAILEELAK